MTGEKIESVFSGIKNLAYKDALAIDSMAKALNISQEHIYRLFIEYHELMFSRLHGNDKEETE